MGQIKSDKEGILIPGFPAGMNNVSPEYDLPANDFGVAVAARDAKNVDFIDRAGKYRRRAGYTKVIDASSPSSLFADSEFPYMLVAVGGTIEAIDPQLVSTPVVGGLADTDVSCCELNGEVLWTIGNNVTGRINDLLENRPLGLPMCGIGALAAQDNGGLVAGVYQVCLSYMTESGEEGGVGKAGLVTVAANGGILVTLPMANPVGCDYIRVWVSEPNGTLLYHVDDIPAGTPAMTIDQGPRGKDNRELLNLIPLPPGSIIRNLNGIVWMAQGRYLLYSEAMRAGLYNPAKNFIGLSKPVDMMQPVGDSSAAGMYVGSGDRVIWFGGATPKQSERRLVRMRGAVPGTGISVPYSLLGGESSIQVAMWMGKDGVPCIGLPGGVVKPMTEYTVAMHSFERGASLLRRANGVTQFVVVGSGATVSKVGAGDSAEVFQYRNGIPVP